MKTSLLKQSRYIPSCLFLFMFMASCLWSGAQSIKGIVTSKDGNLPGATVSISSLKRSVSTNLQGAFSVSVESNGVYQLMISYVGYKDTSITINHHSSISDVGTIELLPASGGILGDVVVKGTMAPSQAKAYSIKKASLAIMDVMAADAIGKLPDRNAAEAVQRMQGVAVARYHGEADQATVRGTPFAWTSTMINGSRLPSSNVMGNRSTVLDAVPSEIIQYVQVAKALTPDWEGDAIGGSINFITRTAPSKRILNASMAGGYNTFSKNGTYNGSLTYGDRFIKNKLGVILSGALWDRQWGADSYDISYNTGLADPAQRNSVNNIMFKRYMGKRQTMGLNLGLEYVFNSSNKLFARGLMDKFNDIRPVYESYIDYTNTRYQYNYRYSHYQTKLNGAELGGEHDLNANLKIDWSVSNYLSEYFLETPSTNSNKGLPIATFRQRIAGGFSDLSIDGKKYWEFDAPDGKGGTPENYTLQLNNPTESMNAEKLTLQQLVIAQLNTKEQDKTAQFNIKFTVNSRLNLKFGAKYRYKDRESTYGSNFVFLPGAAVGIPNSPALLTLQGLNRESFPIGHGFFKEMDGNYDQLIMQPLTKQQLFDLYDTANLRKNGFRNYTSASNATNFYHGNEQVTAGYLMAEWDATSRLKFTGGFRNEYTSLKLYGSKATVSGTPAVTTITPATVISSYNALLPMLHVKYKVKEAFNLRAAYTKTFIRPNFGDMTPGESENTTGNPILITKGNSDLKPTFANNFDLMGEYYFKNIGLLSGGFFYKDLKNLIFNDRTSYTENGNNYLLSQAKNINNATLYGFEAGINKRFNFLKGFWSGLGVEFNYTFINSSVKVPRISGDNHQIIDKTTLPNQSKHLFNAIIFYERNGVMVRLAGNYRGASVESINQQLGKDYYIWTDKNFTIDASATVAVTNRIKVFVELNNLTDAPLKTYMGDKRRSTMNEWYGSRGQAGIRWDIIK